MSSLFERLYKNRQSEQGRNQKENFLTEIFAHCLKIDLKFRNSFLNQINCKESFENFDCKTQLTQSEYKEFGRPDIDITLDEHTKIIIECKVDSTQGENQLGKYADLLKTNKTKKKYLIFLTKFYERPTVADDDEIIFSHLRWYQIYDLLKETSSDLSKELLNYFIEQKMNIDVIPFAISDINAITYINDTIQKMDGVLNRLSHILSFYSNNKIRKAEIGQLTNWAQYGIETDFNGGILWLGFYQYEHNNEMQIGLDFTISIASPNLKKFTGIFKANGWDTYDNNDGTRTWYNAKPLSSFIEDQIFYAEKVFAFIEEALVKTLKNERS